MTDDLRRTVEGHEARERKFFPVLHGCARCGEDHANVTFQVLERPVLDVLGKELYSHFALCPTTGAPIMLMHHAGSGANGIVVP